MNVRDFINTTNMVSFGTLNNQIRWNLAAVAYIAVSCWLMTRPDQFNEAGVLIANGAGMRTLGYDLAVALLIGFGAATGINAASRFGKSATSEKYVEAKTRGKNAGAKQVITSEGGPITAQPGAALQSTEIEPQAEAVPGDRPRA